MRISMSVPRVRDRHSRVSALGPQGLSASTLYIYIYMYLSLSIYIYIYIYIYYMYTSVYYYCHSY